ncbi:MAG: hypothetical protein ABW174_11470 [Flavitalea sp.]
MPQSLDSFFADYGEALLTFSGEKIAEFYQVPLAIYSDQGIQTVTDHQQVAEFWKQGVKQYADKKIANTRAEILEQDQLSKTIEVAKVKWSNFDINGKDAGGETNFYILSNGEDGLKISGLIIMAQ